MSYFLTAGTDASNSLTIRLISRSKIRFIMMVAPIDSCKTLTTWGKFFLLTLFFPMAILASYIIISAVAEKVTMGGVGARFSFTGFYLSNQTFLGMIYSFFFSIY